MACRDLTAVFRERRNAKMALRQLEQWTEENVVDGLLTAPEYEGDVEVGVRRRSNSRGLGGDDVTKENPSWVVALREIEVRCEKAECELRRLAQVQRKRSLVGFDGAEEKRLERELSDAADTARTHLKLAESLLKGGLLEPSPKDTDATVRCKANAKKKLAAKLSNISRRFRTSKSPSGGGKKNMSSSDMAALDFLTSSAERRALDMLETRRPGDVIVTVEQAAALEEDSKFLDERDEEIIKVAQSVDDIAHIFKELAVLVIDQGTILDRIDFNMDIVADRTRHATNQLMKADQHHASAKPLKCLLLLMVLIFILSTILVFKIFGGSSRRKRP